jgi:hypothetical protein
MPSTTEDLMPHQAIGKPAHAFVFGGRFMLAKLIDHAIQSNQFDTF